MKKSRLLEDVKALSFTLPALIPLLLFWFIPLGYISYLSFVEWDFMSPTKEFVGLNNYKELLTNPAFYQSLKVTILFCLGSVIPNMVVGLALAVLLSSSLKGGSLYRTMMFAPWVTPTVAISIVWSWIYEPEVGLANTILRGLGVDGIRWLESSSWALVAVLIVTVWKAAGWCMIFYLVAIQNISKSLLEAADLDGASGWSKFKYITLPLISPTTFFLAVVQLIAAMQAYDQINVLTQGGPAGSTRTLLYMYYQSAFKSFQIGEASTIAIALIIGCAVLSLFSLYVSRKSVHYS